MIKGTPGTTLSITLAVPPPTPPDDMPSKSKPLPAVGYGSRLPVQGYLAHKKQPPPLGPP